MQKKCTFIGNFHSENWKAQLLKIQVRELLNQCLINKLTICFNAEVIP
jgi:hypothetical protein